MFKDRFLIFATAACFGLPLGASTILNTYPDGPSAYTNVYLEQAQTFTVGPDNILTSFEFQMFNAPGQSVQLEVFAWGPTGPTGPALFTSLSLQRLNQVQNFQITGINLALTQGSLYGAVIDNLNNYSGQDAAFNLNQTSYTAGNMWLRSADPPQNWTNFPGDNLLFQATFTASAPGPAPSTPEPATFALIGGGLTSLGLLRKRVLR